MSIKTIKTRDAFGQPIYQEAADFDGLVAISWAILRDNPKNERATAFLKWVASLDHKPTSDEFEAWTRSIGINITPIVPEDYEN